MLDGQLRRVRAGESSVLVLRGEAGVGKTALLEYVADRASGCRILRVAGVESEMELAFAGLHQLCVPMLDRLDGLPGPQQDALRVAFGLQDGAAPNRFLVALAVLSLLAEAAEAEPLVCLIDDTQWLDQASVQALAFVARRLLAERIGMVFTVRDPNDVDEFTGLPELVVGGLADDEARRLLASAMPGRLDEHVLDRIIAENARQPTRVAGAAAWIDAGGARGRVRSSRRATAGRPRRGIVLATGPGASGRGPAPPVGGRGRAGRRREPVVARGRAARDQR